MLIVLPLPGGAGGSVDDTTSFDAFGGAFSGTLPEALPAGIEPTVTINTLAAYSDMNDMFQSALPHTTFGGADSGSSGLGEEDGSILIREDTQFLPQGAANDNAHHDAQPGTMPASPSETLFAESIPHQAVLAASTAASKNARIIDAVLPAPAAVEPDSISGFHDEVINHIAPGLVLKTI